MNTPTHFFIFSLGPVQSFIAQARKAQDLYLGCQMISDYCRHAAMVFEKEGGKVTFPKWQSTSLTNRFMGTIDFGDKTQEEIKIEAERIGKTVANSVKERFVKEGLLAIKAGLGGYDACHIKGVKEQLETHLETYWAFSPYDEHDYAGSYKEAEQVFGMSKYMRTPKQMVYQGDIEEYEKELGWEDFTGETGRKCVVDGERNVKFYRFTKDELDHKKNIFAKASTASVAKEDLIAYVRKHKLFLESENEVCLIFDTEGNTSQVKHQVDIQCVPPKFIQDGEGLSAVSFFKRCYKPDAVHCEKGVNCNENNPINWESLKNQLLNEPQSFYEEKYKLHTTKGGKKYYLQGIEYPTTAKLALYDLIDKSKSDEPQDSNFINTFEQLVNASKRARPDWYSTAFPKHRLEDEELYFEENLTEKYFERHTFEETKLSDLKKIRENASDALKKEFSDTNFQQYYALVSFDIDGLGKVLKPDGVTQKYHEELAKKLHEFADKVQEIVEGSSNSGGGESSAGPGRILMLYAGGDDFLYAINLKHLFPTLDAIQKKSSSLFKEQEIAGVKINITYSTSVVIAHYKSPLTRAVKAVKEELSKVKERFKDDGKNGIAMSFMMKSGATTSSYFKQNKLSLLQGLFEALRDEEGEGKEAMLSPKFIFQFAKNMEEMGFDGEIGNSNQEQMRSFALWELKRLIRRAKENNRDWLTEYEYELKGIQESKPSLEALIQEQLQKKEGKEYFDLQNLLQFFKMAELTSKHTNTWKSK